jgi:transcriptional regulator with XRE-family HTH domain
MAENSLSKVETETLEALGSAISVSRRARRIRQKDLCESVGIGINTLVSIEKGVPTVQIGHYIRVMHALDRLEPIRRAA